MFEGKSCEGKWSDIEALDHINVLELRAILFGFKIFSSEIGCNHIRVRSSNSTQFAYVNNFGGTKSLACHELSEEVFEWTSSGSVLISAEHLPGFENVLTDAASCIFDGNTGWNLNDTSFVKS